MTSEYVSIGHPDRVCDYISCRILDEYAKQDPKTRYALEVQMKDNTVNLAGEITSAFRMSNDERADIVRAALREIGYSAEYAFDWDGKCPNADKVVVNHFIGEQSRDIAAGVDRDGWGDQGIFHGMAVAGEKYLMPKDHMMAREIGLDIYNRRIGGVDIKTQVSISGSGNVDSVVVAVPTRAHKIDETRERVLESIARCVGYIPESVTINGTGAYETHGAVGDCGTTGRKLAVDFYGGNCVIGGGSPWTKDATKADLTLNVYARKLAVENLKQMGLEKCFVQISACIGKREIGVEILDGANRVVASWKENKHPSEVIAEVGLYKARISDLQKIGIGYFITQK